MRNGLEITGRVADKASIRGPGFCAACAARISDAAKKALLVLQNVSGVTDTLAS